MSTKLILIRHGQTDWNIKKKYCGSVDIGLNETGRKQIRRLRDRLKSQKIDKVYASDKKRAIQTAEIIFKGREIELISDLREMHFGVFEGLTYKQVMKKYASLYKKWLDDPFSITMPKGESLFSFKKRVIKAIRSIISKNRNKAVAVICHGGPISMIISYALKSRQFWQNIPDSASLSIIEYSKSNKPIIRLQNDTSYLNNSLRK